MYLLMSEINAAAPEGKNTFRHITYIFLKNILFLGYTYYVSYLK
jgi:hypothetical protein